MERVEHAGAAALLRLHRGCRLAESGDRDQAAVALDGLRESMATLADPRARDISRVAGAVLLNLRPVALDRGAAAHVLGSAAAVLPGAQLVALLIVLLADRDANVAVNAVAAVRRALPDVLPDAVQRGLWRMTGASGVARPLAAAGLLASRGSLDSVTRERLAQHRSALVRTVVSVAA